MLTWYIAAAPRASEVGVSDFMATEAVGKKACSCNVDGGMKGGWHALNKAVGGTRGLPTGCWP